MYSYVDPRKIKDIKPWCGDLMQELCHRLKDDYHIGARPYSYGSSSRNMITQNGNGIIDFDYDLLLVKIPERLSNPCQLKDIIRHTLNKILNEEDLGDCKDSTSTLTTNIITKGKIDFKIDICIIKEEHFGKKLRLVNKKWSLYREYNYVWEPSKNINNLDEKVEYIKDNDSWEDVRDEYLYLKNMYLQRNDHNHPSYVCYIEAVNNVYNRIYNPFTYASRQQLCDMMREYKPFENALKKQLAAYNKKNNK